MTDRLSGKKVAFLVTSGFEEAELVQPRDALRKAGAEVDVVSPKRDLVRAWNHQEWGADFHVDRHIDDVTDSEYQGLVLPGGVLSPDLLRLDRRAVRLVSAFVTSGKPVAAICHGPWLLIEADVVRGMRVTSFPSLRTDLLNALAEWVDEPVVIDGNIVTSRRPDDLPDFCAAIIGALSTPLGAHEPRELREGLCQPDLRRWHPRVPFHA